MIELSPAAGLGEHAAGHRPPTFGPTRACSARIESERNSRGAIEERFYRY
jgi:hypothetical protein